MLETTVAGMLPTSTQMHVRCTRLKTSSIGISLTCIAGQYLKISQNGWRGTYKLVLPKQLVKSRRLIPTQVHLLFLYSSHLMVLISLQQVQYRGLMERRRRKKNYNSVRLWKQWIIYWQRKKKQMLREI